ncbi:MAG: hypothetical protein LW837_26845 [Roseomonas sp.]|nr:hypothetical protein [Roseomonas sp.]
MKFDQKGYEDDPRNACEYATWPLRQVEYKQIPINHGAGPVAKGHHHFFGGGYRFGNQQENRNPNHPAHNRAIFTTGTLQAPAQRGRQKLHCPGFKATRICQSLALSHSEKSGRYQPINCGNPSSLGIRQIGACGLRHVTAYEDRALRAHIQVCQGKLCRGVTLITKRPPSRAGPLLRHWPDRSRKGAAGVSLAAPQVHQRKRPKLDGEKWVIEKRLFALPTPES